MATPSGKPRKRSITNTRSIIEACLVVVTTTLLVGAALRVFSGVDLQSLAMGGDALVVAFALPVLLVGGQVVFGLLAVSAFRRGRRSPYRSTQTGITTNVSETALLPGEAAGSCAICDGPVGTGTKRTYRRDVVVCGVPLNLRHGYNEYCQQCLPDVTVDREHATEPTAADAGPATYDREYELDMNR